MKVAIIHDWLVINGGAEKVLRSILDLYPSADIFSLVDFLDQKDREHILCGKFAKTSFLQNLPFSKKHFRKYLPLFPIAITRFDLSSYDLVISSSWAVAKGVITHKKQLHISYYQARNMKYVWDEKELYFTGIKRLIKPFVINYLRRFDIKSSSNADFIISNSNFVKNWVLDKYNRSSGVIYPPVNTHDFIFCNDKDDFYITVARLVSYKRIKLIVEAFNKMPDKKLIVIGDGDEYNEIKSIAKENINMVGFKNSQELVPYIQKARAFLYSAIEDFGIVIIEALSCGTPVIALNKGGTAETITDKVTGIHFSNQTVDSIVDAVYRFEKHEFNHSLISDEATKYSNKRFQFEFKQFVDEKYSLFVNQSK